MKNNNRKMIALIGGLVGGALLVTAAVVWLLLFNKQDGSANSPITPIPKATADQGLQVFQQQCTICHPNDGKRPGNGPALTKSKVVADYPKLFEQIRQGKGQMPAFSSQQVSDADISNIYAYLQSIKS